MKTMVKVTREVEVHAHRFQLHVRPGKGEDSLPSLTLTCLCGNGFAVDAPVVYVYGVATEQTVLLSTLLEMAAEEQDKRHRDW